MRATYDPVEDEVETEENLGLLGHKQQAHGVKPYSAHYDFKGTLDIGEVKEAGNGL